MNADTALRALVALLAATAAVVSLGSPVNAAVPGGNGRIVFASTRDSGFPAPEAEIYAMAADGSDPVRLTVNAANDAWPVWSPDGTAIAFVSDRDSDPYEFDVYLMGADGSTPTRLTHTGRETNPTWSPDGTRIAFSSSRDGDNEIYVMNADGSNETRLTTGAEAVEPAWSPDGTRIVYVSYVDPSPGFTNPLGEIYVMNADGSGATRLTDNPGPDHDPAWSPDGSRIAFSSGRGADPSTPGIYVMDAEGSDLSLLTTSAHGDREPAWSPDGASVAFTRTGEFVYDHVESEIHTIDVDGTNDVGISGVPLDFDPDWQPMPSVDLAVDLAVSWPRKRDPLTYTVTVTNNGPSNALGVVLTDELPSQTTFVQASPSAGTCTTPAAGQPGTVSCAIGFVPLSGQVTIDIVVQVQDRKPPFTNSVSAAARTSDPNAADNTATVSTSRWGTP